MSSMNIIHVIRNSVLVWQSLPLTTRLSSSFPFWWFSMIIIMITLEPWTINMMKLLVLILIFLILSSGFV